jgi:hypothetical protein
MKTHFPRTLFALPVLCSALLFVSCKRKDEIRVYEVIVPPGASAPAQPAMGSAQPAGPAAAAAAAVSGVSVKWKSPATWETQPLSNLINKGYYRLPEISGSQPELTISAYPGTAGGLTANVNRWRRQIGLPELEAAELEKEIGSLDVSGQTLRVCELVGNRPDGTATFVLGAVLSLPEETWFFKMTGQAPALEASRTIFREFIQSLEIGGTPPPASAAPAPNPPPGPSASGQNSPVKVGFVVPNGWEEQPSSGMRDASFRIPGPDGKDADVSLLRLSGGTDAQNVNMWRQQLGLATLPEAEAAGALPKVKAGAREVRFYDQSGSGEAADRPRILAAIWDESGTTWVARARGGHAQLEAQKESFVAFLSSLQLP